MTLVRLVLALPALIVAGAAERPRRRRRARMGRRCSMRDAGGDARSRRDGDPLQRAGVRLPAARHARGTRTRRPRCPRRPGSGLPRLPNRGRWSRPEHAGADTSSARWPRRWAVAAWLLLRTAVPAPAAPGRERRCRVFGRRFVERAEATSASLRLLGSRRWCCWSRSASTPAMAHASRGSRRGADRHRDAPRHARLRLRLAEPARIRARRAVVAAPARPHRDGLLEWAVSNWGVLGGEFLGVCLALVIVMGLAGPFGDRWWIPGSAAFIALGATFAFVFPWLPGSDTEPLRDRASSPRRSASSASRASRASRFVSNRSPATRSSSTPTPRVRAVAAHRALGHAARRLPPAPGRGRSPTRSATTRATTSSRASPGTRSSRSPART